MALTIDEVRDIAHLARLGVDEHRLDSLAADLSRVLELATSLQAANTAGVEPMAHPVNAALRLREDIVTEANERQFLQAPAPAVRDGYYLVPRVIE